MIQKYTTKRDINGNRYTLIIDHEKRTISRGYNTAWNYDDYITISRRDRAMIFESLTAAGYESI